MSCISLAGTASEHPSVPATWPRTARGHAPTGKTCTGECKTAADCCEIPVNLVIGATIYHNCNDIQNQVIGGSAATVCAGLTAGDTSTTGLGCFYFNAYCNGCSGAWTCDSNHLCQYTNDCAASGLSYKGCAAKSRTGRTTGFVSTCSSAGKCSGTATATGCIADTDCAGLAYIPFSATYANNATCRAPTSSGGTTDCTCYQHQCYLACSNDLECATGYKCDAGTKLCTPTGACGSDAQCATILGDITAKCTSGDVLHSLHDRPAVRSVRNEPGDPWRLRRQGLRERYLQDPRLHHGHRLQRHGQHGPHALLLRDTRCGYRHGDVRLGNHQLALRLQAPRPAW